eukprot:2205893-Rhodomonas_salina.1
MSGYEMCEVSQLCVYVYLHTDASTKLLYLPTDASTKRGVWRYKRSDATNARASTERGPTLCDARTVLAYRHSATWRMNIA